MNATTGAPFDDLYSVQPFAHSVPAPSQPFAALSASIVFFWFSNGTVVSFSPAAWKIGIGLYESRTPLAAAAVAVERENQGRVLGRPRRVGDQGLPLDAVDRPLGRLRVGGGEQEQGERERGHGWGPVREGVVCECKPPGGAGVSPGY